MRITFVQEDGTEFPLQVEPGINLMEAALGNGIPGIDGDCGGNAACGTCHVRIGPEWGSLLSPASEDELAMLEFAEDVLPTSRLACQIIASTDLDGIAVHLPLAQH